MDAKSASVTHDLYLGVLETPSELADDPDFVPQPKMRRVRPGEAVRILKRWRDSEGESVVLVSAERPNLPAGSHIIRWHLLAAGASYLLLEMKKTHWSESRSGALSLVRVLKADQVQALTADEVARLQGSLADDRIRRTAPTSRELDAILLPPEKRSGETTVRVSRVTEKKVKRPVTEIRDGRLILLEPGIPVRVSLGSEFAVRLVEHPSTGYSWRFGEPLDERLLEKRGSEYEPADPSKIPCPGDSNPFYLVFRATAPGRTRIVLHHQAPSGGEPQAVLDFQIIIE